MRKINIFAAIFALLSVAMTGCTGEFEYFNTDKHSATEGQMSHDNLKTGAFFRQLQRSVVFFQYGSDETFTDGVHQMTQNLNSDSYAGYLTPTIETNSGTHMGSYSMSPESWVNAQYNYTFTYAMPAWLSLKETADELGQPEVAALGTIVKVAAMHRTTDYYGPIPYVSFGDGSINSLYDSQEDVYNKFFEELDGAIDELTQFSVANPGVSIMADYDYVYGGDVTRWIKFANTLRLRLALRVVYANASLAQTEATKSLNHSIGCMTDVNDGAALNRVADLSTYHHPLYMIVTSFGNAGSETVMGASMDAYMNGYQDPRRAAYFVPAPTDGSYHGVRPGVRTTTWTNLRSTSGYVSIPVVDATSMKIVWMNASEAYFLRAEAALRGWGGDAQSLYEQGIRMSFDENKVSGADTYLTNTNRSGTFTYTPQTRLSSLSGSSSVTNIPRIAWNASDTFEVNLERIIIQKWISMYPNGPEGWAEARRTGYPKLLPVVNNNSGGAVATGSLIRRISFPPSEVTNNPEGVASGVAKLGGPDNVGTRLWWDCKN